MNEANSIENGFLSGSAANLLYDLEKANFLQNIHVSVFKFAISVFSCLVILQVWMPYSVAFN